MSGRKCGHDWAMKPDPWCSECADFSRMHNLDHRSDLTKAQSKELKKLEKRFNGR